jgi:type IV pilus assembly protein PilC
MLAGSSIYEPLAQSGAFPVVVTRMIQVGEETGKLETMLVKIAEFFEEEVDLSIKGLTAIIEPIMIIGIGLTIGIVILSIYLPMFSIYDKIGMIFPSLPL